MLESHYEETVSIFYVCSMKHVQSIFHQNVKSGIFRMAANGRITHFRIVTFLIIFSVVFLFFSILLYFLNISLKMLFLSIVHSKWNPSQSLISFSLSLIEKKTSQNKANTNSFLEQIIVHTWKALFELHSDSLLVVCKLFHFRQDKDERKQQQRRQP